MHSSQESKVGSDCGSQGKYELSYNIHVIRSTCRYEEAVRRRLIARDWCCGTFPVARSSEPLGRATAFFGWSRKAFELVFAICTDLSVVVCLTAPTMQVYVYHMICHVERGIEPLAQVT